MAPPDPDQREQRFIDTLLQAAPPQLSLRVAPGDDAAVLRDGTAITADTLIESVHFDERLSAADVGWKAVAVSASDLGAMGAVPTWMILCLSLPRDSPADWIADFGEGLGAAAEAFGVSLIGGDTTRSPGPRVATITMGGRCVGTPIVRSGARPDDRIWVTGRLGLAGAGWILDDPPARALERLRRPHPPVALGAELARAGLPTSMMDLSDGLAADLVRLCRASGCGATVDPDALPMPAVLAGRPDAQALMLCGGEDYELLFTSAPASDAAIRTLAASAGVEVSVIGQVRAEPVLSLGRSPWPAPAFRHFEGTP